jgi:multimeric flavodoxin WrbA
MKKVVILAGSPHLNGTTAALVEHMLYGAQAVGHKVERFNVATMKVGSCKACMACHKPGGDGKCVQRDDMDKIGPAVVAADVVIFATPLYYFDMTSQLKTVIDRFFSYGESMKKPKEVYLLLACGGPDAKSFAPVTGVFEGICAYLGWTIKGKVLASGCMTPGDLEKTPHCMTAYEMGQKI